MTRTAGEIIEQAHLILQDDGTRWSPAELYLWIDEAQRFVAKVVPEALAAQATVTLATGAEQTLPDDGVFLFRVLHDGSGYIPRQTTKRGMDVISPNWHKETASSSIRQYMMDDYEPRRYWVYPPNNGASATIEYQRKPAPIVGDTTALSCADHFFTAVLDYVLYRAYDKDAEDAVNKALSESHYNRAISHLGITPRAAKQVVEQEKANG
mgnify:CR=1 FL=1